MPNDKIFKRDVTNAAGNFFILQVLEAFPSENRQSRC